MPSALIIGTKGSEDIELVATSDILRRAKVDVTVVSLDNTETIVCGQKTEIKVDGKIKDVVGKLYDAVILPGGPGCGVYNDCPVVGDILKHHQKEGKIIGAICAASLALARHKIAPNATLTSYPSVEKEIRELGYKYDSTKSVLVDGKIVTSRGPATAIEFGLKLAELLVDKDTRDKLAKGTLFEQ
uniref:DJ-1_PfpI domain-containing protein n=1 Tax=Rhabditophanes sp. KR3021 TaxID=114890 RepID=A0AC35U8T1_9BILA